MKAVNRQGRGHAARRVGGRRRAKQRRHPDSEGGRVYNHSGATWLLPGIDFGTSRSRHAGASSLQSTLSRKIDTTIVPLIRGKTGHICIIDPPGYSNVGDSAILLGELDFIA